MVIISQNAIKHGFLSLLAEINGELRAPGDLFMQNKAKFLRDKMNVIPYNTWNNGDFAALRLWKNKAKQSQFHIKRKE